MIWLRCMASRVSSLALISSPFFQPKATICKVTRWSQISKLSGPRGCCFSGYLKALSYHSHGVAPLGFGDSRGPEAAVGLGGAEGPGGLSFSIKGILPFFGKGVI